MALAQSEPKIVYSIAPPDAQALFCRRRVPTQERADPRWSMKASTQLFDDFGGSGIPLRRAEKILTSLLTNTRLQFFGNHWRFLDNRSGFAQAGPENPPLIGLSRRQRSEPSATGFHEKAPARGRGKN